MGVKNIIRQNKKAALQEFLFGKNEVNQDQTLGLIPHLQDQIKALKNQVDSLQQKVINLEIQLKNLEHALRHALRSQNKAPEAMKTIQQADYTMKSEWVENDGKVNSEVGDQNYGLKEMEETSKMPLQSQQYNQKAQNAEAKQQIFVTLGKISEHD